MPIVSIESLIQKSIKDKVYVVDTNFIINCSSNDNKDPNIKLAKQLKTKLLNNKCILVFNVITRNELLHNLREVSLLTAFEKNTVGIDSKIIATHNRAKELGTYKGIAKWVLQSGYGSILKELFGPNGDTLQKYYNDLTDGFAYQNGNGNSNSNSWDNLVKIMAEHALDSSDAMILNFALGNKTYNGLISMDSDFNYCVNTKDFEIIIPDKYISDKTRNKLWK